MPYIQMPGVVGAVQNLQENSLMMQAQQSDLRSAALNQEGTKLTLDAKKAELANQEAFKQNVLAQMAKGEDNQGQLATLANQPTQYQEMHNNLSATTDKIKSQVSLVQATQKAIEQFSKTDPSYAMKMQTELNKQIEDGFKLTKAHNDIVSKEASKVSDELAPVVNAGGEPGKVDPALYKEWYARNKADGVPLASMGLTGDPALDDKAIRLIYSKGVAAKDQASQQAKMLEAKQRKWRNEQMNQYHTQSLAIRRSGEALQREKLDYQKTKPTKGSNANSPIALWNNYDGKYQALSKEWRKAADSDRPAVEAAMATLTSNYNRMTGQQGHPIPTTTKSKISNVVPTTLPSTDKIILGDKFGIH